LKKVAAVVAGGAPRPGCLAAREVTPSSLAECGILLDASSRNVTGRETVAALEAAALASRGGARR